MADYEYCQDLVCAMYTNVDRARVPGPLLGRTLFYSVHSHQVMATPAKGIHQERKMKHPAQTPWSGHPATCDAHFDFVQAHGTADYSVAARNNLCDEDN